MTEQNSSTHSMDPNPDRHSIVSRLIQSTRFSQFVIWAVVFAVYGGILGHSLLSWDDDLHITSNPHLNPLTWKSLSFFWTSPYEGLYIPVSYNVFAAESLLSKTLGFDWQNPVIFKLGSLLLHGGCVAIVCSLLRNWIGQTPAALWGALVFAVHPLQVESVAWTSETRGLLSTLFSFASIWSYCRFAQGSSVSIVTETAKLGSCVDRRILWYFTAMIFFALGLLSKPSAIFVLPTIVVIDKFLIGRQTQRIVISILPWIALAGFDFLLTKSLQPDTAIPNLVSLPYRFVVAGDALAFYLEKIVWPTGLTMDYGRTPQACLADRFAILRGLVPVGLCILLLICHAPRIVWISGALLVAGCLPVLGLVPFAFQEISTVGDRYAYPGMLGVALLFAWLWQMAPGKPAKFVLAALVVMLSAGASHQTGVWRDNRSLYAHAIEQNPNSWIVMNNQGDLLADAGHHREAEKLFRHALQVRPNYARAAYNLGFCLRSQGDEQSAHKEFERAVQLAPANSQFQEALGESYQRRGNTAEAKVHYLAALKVEPNSPKLLNQLANLSAALGQREEAVTYYRRAIQIQPDFWPARVNYGGLLLSIGETRTAEDQFLMALKSNPHQPIVRFNVGLIAAREGRFDDAITSLELAHTLAEDAAFRQAVVGELAVAYNSRGLQEHQSQQFATAVQSFERALSWNPKLAAGHFNLARTLAAIGKREAAAEHFRKAAALLPKDSPAAADIDSQLRELQRLETQSHED